MVWWADHPWSAAVVTHLSLSLLVYLYSSLAALLRRDADSRGALEPGDLRLTALKPLRGLDPGLEENLRSFADLDVPEGFEVLLLCDDEADEALPLARRFAAASPRFKVVVGTTPGVANPKVASLLAGLPHAANALLWVTDSNVRTSDAHLRAQVLAWRWAQRGGRRPTLVHAPLTADGGAGLGALFERLHLSTYNNISAHTTRAVKVDAVVGKSLVVHRDDLVAVGGLAAFGAAGGEDFALGVAFRKAGTVALANVATSQALGRVSLADFFRRQARWAALRKRTGPGSYFILEPFSLLGLLWLWLALGVVPWPVASALFGLKVAVDAAVLRAYAPRLSPAHALLAPFKDLVVLAAWARASFQNSLTWRGRRLEVRRDGSYALPSDSAAAKSTSEPQ